MGFSINCSLFGIFIMMSRINIFKCFSVSFIGMMLIAPNCQARTMIDIVTEFMPPLQLAKPGQKMQGLTADLVNSVVQDSQLHSTSNVFPWSRSYLLARTKPNVLIYPIIRTKEREDDFHWIGKIWSFSAAIYKHVDRANINVEELNDAKKYNISVYRNDFFHHYLLKNGFSASRLSPVADIEQSIKLFISGRVDLIVIDSSIFEYYLKQFNHDPTQYKQLVKLTDVKHKDAYIALSKSSSSIMVSKLLSSYQKVSKSDKFVDIRRTWADKLGQ